MENRKKKIINKINGYVFTFPRCFENLTQPHVDFGDPIAIASLRDDRLPCSSAICHCPLLLPCFDWCSPPSLFLVIFSILSSHSPLPSNLFFPHYATSNMFMSLLWPSVLYSTVDMWLVFLNCFHLLFIMAERALSIHFLHTLL